MANPGSAHESVERGQVPVSTVQALVRSFQLLRVHWLLGLLFTSGMLWRDSATRLVAATLLGLLCLLTVLRMLRRKAGEESAGGVAGLLIGAAVAFVPNEDIRLGLLICLSMAVLLDMVQAHFLVKRCLSASLENQRNGDKGSA